MCLEEGSGHGCLCSFSVSESSIKALRTHQEAEIPAHVIYTFYPYSLQTAYKSFEKKRLHCVQKHQLDGMDQFMKHQAKASNIWS